MQDIFETKHTPKGYSKEEWEARVQLALCYRLIDHYGWTAQVYNHITYRIANTEHLLINAFGLMYHEIKPSNLVKIDLDGNVLDDSPYPVNKAGLNIHTAIHKARKDLSCVLHTHDLDAIAVSCLEGGFMPLEQQGYMFYERTAYHKFEGIVLDESEKARLIASLGDKNHTLFLHNHGIITAGHSIEWAFVRMYHLIRACQIQLKVLSTGGKIIQADKEVIRHTREQFEGGAAQAGAVVQLPEWPAYYRLITQKDPSWCS